MLTLLRHLLLIGALFGLAGNTAGLGGVAAAAPCSMTTMEHMAGMPDAAMAAPCPDCPAKDGKGTKSGCTMMAGCAFAVAMKEPAAVAASLHGAPIPDFWPVTTVLAGRSLAPEPEPPTLLG